MRDFEILPKVDNKKLTFPSTVTADLVAWQPFDAVNNTGSELSYILVYCGTVCVILESFQKHFLFGIIQNWNPSKKKKQNKIFNLKFITLSQTLFFYLCVNQKKKWKVICMVLLAFEMQKFQIIYSQMVPCLKL